MSQLVDIHSPEFRQFLRETLQEMLEQFVRANEQRSRELALMERGGAGRRGIESPEGNRISPF